MGDDLELLRAWSEGDQAAGNRLVRRHFDSVARFFQSKIDAPATVADLIQRTFLGCVRARERAEGITSFRAYALGVARRQLLEHFRQHHRESKRLELLETSVHELGESPSQVAAMRQEQKFLLAALQRLPLEIQMAVELHYWEQLPEREIAEVLEIPQGTVKSRLSRGRELLRKHVGDVVATPQQLESTMHGLETWARGLRGKMGRD
ncbi:MAG TPA: sigma-70 family RNA polymerase sigma factor [Nannocystaceae bacterium]|nr:sigma-70 family RNA polymerase sigma factor [Nannocystaceae bacterium]